MNFRYRYFFMNTYPHFSCLGISKLIAEDVIDIWKAVNPRLPLLKEISVVNKVRILCFQKAKQISRKHLPAAQIKFWKEKLDTFFDISSCSCNLPILSCDNINVKCTKEKSQTKHIICTCLPTKKPTKKYEDIPTNSFNNGDSSHSYSSSPSDETEDYKQLDSPLQVPYNLTKMPRYAPELVRGDIFSNLGASLAHALLSDLRAIDLFIPNIDIKNIYMDKCKIEQRQKWKQMPMKSIMKMWRIFFV